MAEGRDELYWRPWAEWLAMYHNAHCEKGAAIHPASVGPYATRRPAPAQKLNLRELAAASKVNLGIGTHGSK